MYLSYLLYHPFILTFFFFNDTATTEIYTLSLHDALPISSARPSSRPGSTSRPPTPSSSTAPTNSAWRNCTKPNLSARSEEHTSELQSQSNLVCRLLLEKKKKYNVIKQNADT